MKDINYLKSYKNRIAIDKIIKKLLKKKYLKDVTFNMYSNIQ